MAKTQISTNKAPAAVGPYSQAISSGNLIFVSGQIPLDPTTNTLIKGDIQAQTKQICQNISEILATQNLTLADVVKTTVFITDMNQFAKVNEIYKQYFPEPCPARSCVEVSKLPLGVEIEIEVIAALSA
ncbi:MAG: RidA family protein [Desulfovibrionaceae bacterium]|nr:RidA family protein [Desulfovibrionaceae bacterium]